MAQILEALHRADRAVVVLQDALKGSANAVDPATTRGHELTHGATVLRLSSDDRRKFEDMLAAAQVGARLVLHCHACTVVGVREACRARLSTAVCSMPFERCPRPRHMASFAYTCLSPLRVRCLTL